MLLRVCCSLGGSRVRSNGSEVDLGENSLSLEGCKLSIKHYGARETGKAVA